MATTMIAVERAGWRDYWALTKPRVVAMLLVTAMVGMVLAPSQGQGLGYFLAALYGLWAGMASAAVINQWVDQHFDAIMARTQGRPLVQGRVSGRAALLWAAALAASSMLVLTFWVNELTAWLTALGMVGYAGIYTRFLKRATPQNIVIGGLSGALPPLLGWAAVTGRMAPEAWLLVLIIFVWTPPHFWALAIHRRDDYARAGIPMLPVTHGVPLTAALVWYYTILLGLVSLMPYLIGMSGVIYLAAALVLAAMFMREAWLLRRGESEGQAMKTFGFSIVYLLGLFAG
ncbi:MAG: heme o synthase, partial [Perlucidibaca sp.]